MSSHLNIGLAFLNHRFRSYFRDIQPHFLTSTTSRTKTNFLQAADKELIIEHTGSNNSLPEANNTTYGMFMGVSLPSELIILIQKEMYVPDGGNEPSSIRLAFATDPKIYAEYQKECSKTRILVTYGNYLDFKAMPLKKLLRYEHLKVIYEDQSDLNLPVSSTPWKGTTFAGSKAACMNHFSTFNFDLTKHRPGMSGYIEAIQWLINASKHPKALFVKLLGEDVRKKRYHRKSVYEIVEYINKGLGLVGKLERVSPQDCDELWFWESENGDNLPKYR